MARQQLAAAGGAAEAPLLLPSSPPVAGGRRGGGNRFAFACATLASMTTLLHSYSYVMLLDLFLVLARDRHARSMTR
jgi:hypothetical protein